MKTACIILNYNDAENTLKLAHAVMPFEEIDAIILVDNCSTDNSFKTLENNISGKIVCIQTQHNGGYGFGNNYGARYAFNELECDAALIVNPDVSFDRVLISSLKNVLSERKDAGVVSAIQLDANGREIDKSAWRIPSKWNYIFSTAMLLGKFIPTFYYKLEQLHNNPIVQVDCVAGSLLLISKTAFEKTGGYDERMFLYCEETTLGCKLKTVGLKAYICSDESYYHLHGVSISKSIKSVVKQKKIMLESHHLLLKDYLRASSFELAVDTIIGKLSLCEEAIKMKCRSFARRKNQC